MKNIVLTNLDYFIDNILCIINEDYRIEVFHFGTTNPYFYLEIIKRNNLFDALLLKVLKKFSIPIFMITENEKEELEMIIGLGEW